MIIRSFKETLPHCNVERLAVLIKGRLFNEFYPYKTSLTESTLEIQMLHNVNPRESARIILIGRIVRYYINNAMLHEFQIPDDPRPADKKDDRPWGTEEHILKVILDRREECADIVRLFGSCEMNTLASLAKLIIPEWRKSLSVDFLECITPSLRILSYKESRVLINGLATFFNLVPRNENGGYTFASPIESGSTVAFTLAREDGRCLRFMYDPVNLASIQVYYNGRVVKSLCISNPMSYEDLHYFERLRLMNLSELEAYESDMSKPDTK